MLLPKYMTIRQFSAEHAFFTPGSLRSLIFNYQKNGLNEAGAVIRVGRKVLIDESKFFAWIESQSNRAA